MIDASTTHATGTVIEAGLDTEGTASATGSITASDIDASASLSYTSVADSGNATTYGTFSVDGSGTWTYNIDESAADSLDADDTVTETFRVTVDDGLGGTDTQDVVVTIRGTNDAPVIDASTTHATGTVIEAGLDTEGTASATGSITASDIDASASLSYTSVADSGNATTYGTFSVDGSGTWTYNIDESAADSLDADDTVTETFRVTVDDGLGGTDTQDVVVTIRGTNDAPVIDASTTHATGTVIEAGLDTEGTASATGSITASDIDASASLSYTSVADSGNATTYGTFSVDGSGTWTYNIDESAADSLDADDTVTETFRVTVDDGLGGTDTQDVVVTIRGTNDAPVIDASTTHATGTVIEAGLDTEGTASATGSITASDIDASASLSYTSVADSGNATTYGTFSVDGSGTWTYNIDESAADSLDADDTVTETFRVTVDDGLGGTDTQDVVVTIRGTNDAPVIDASTTHATGTVIEAGLDTEGTASATGSITASDIDASASLSYTSVADSGNATTYGTFSVDGSGTWTYNIDESAADSLDADDTVTETFRVTVDDGLGGTDTQDVVVTIRGTNDAPVIDASTTHATGTVIEAGLDTEGTASATGSITASDIDASASLSYTSVADSGNATTYGTFSVDGSGTWTYNIDESAADSLDADDTVTETFRVTVDDGLGGTDTQDVVVTIRGTNDAPVIDASTTHATGTVIEAGLDTEGTASATGSITASDIDASASLSYTSVADSGNATTYGTFSVDGSGTWTYNIDESAADSLDADDTVTETFRVTVDDGLGGTDTQDVVVTIRGTNDAPVIDASTTHATGTVIEAGLDTEGTASATGSITASDIDASASLSYTSVADSGNATTYGTFSVDGSGTWTYNIDESAADSLDADDTVTETFRVTVDDGLGGTDTQDVVVTIRGTNDAPVIDASTTHATGTVIEAGLDTEGTASATGSITASDIDASASLSYTSVADSGNATTYGTFSVDGSGTWTYNIDESAADSLDADDTVTETFRVTVDDGLGGTDTQDVVVTIRGTNDAPTITLTKVADGTLVEDSVATDTQVATFTAKDEEGATTVDFTSGTNNPAYYQISGSTVTLTTAGATFVNGGGTLPEISLTVTESTGDSSTAVATATPVVTPRIQLHHNRRRHCCVKR